MEDNYQKWLEACKADLEARGYRVDTVEICEDGAVYFGGLFITEPGFVTPWEKWREENENG